MTTTNNNNNNVDFYVIENESNVTNSSQKNNIRETKRIINHYKTTAGSIKESINFINELLGDNELMSHIDDFRTKYGQQIDMPTGSEGWNELTESENRFYFAEPERQNITIQETYDRIRNCHELEYLYIIKHNELISLFDLIFYRNINK